ncbi:hypothetical protein LTR42_001267 [Elasticomyces elasticus]|nr:hypothetical protein LTR42_001267 [Elasticomyces elasticus]
MATLSQAEQITLNNHHLKQKRARSQLSCAPCRTGKLKCNREKPHCDQCIKRTREGQCLYIPPPVKHKPVQNVKGRIRQLEELVVDLMNQNNVTTGPQHQKKQQRDNRHESTNSHDQPTPPSDNEISPQFSASTERSQQYGSDEQTPPENDDVDATTTPFGQMRISRNEISYVGDSHWNAILNSISDLKRDLGDDDEDEPIGQNCEGNPLGRSSTNRVGGWYAAEGDNVESAAPTAGLGFMMGNTQAVTREELIAGVPEKKTADRLLSLWFNSPDPFKGIIHAPTFQEEYKRFWRSPKDTPTMWLGLLHAILSLASSFGLRDADPSSPQAQKVLQETNKYHAFSGSAAVLADFTKPREYTIECLIIHTAGLRSNNAFVNVWLMLGLIVRLALRMGYHRDAKHYPSITPFHGEMRRRAWAGISMIDVLISFQLGLPSMVKTIQSDTQPPRNLLDRDFNLATTVLPPSRGPDELTPSSYTRAKLGITRVFANAAELSHATIPPSYEDLMHLDHQLEEAKANIPPLLQMPDISELVTDPAEQLMCRFNLDLLYLKTKTVLHRRYILTPLSQLSSEEQKLGIGRSRKVSLECALRVLQHHHTIYAASQAGGQLESVKWYMGSISTHDFLLAAMIICLELSTQVTASKYLLVNPSGHRCPIRGALIEALEKSHSIWTESSRRKGTNGFNGSNENRKGEQMFDETEKAARAMGVMIKKVRAQFGVSGSAKAIDGELETDPFQYSVLGGYKKSNEAQARSPFVGMVSTYQWGDTDLGDIAGVTEPHNASSESLLAAQSVGQMTGNTSDYSATDAGGASNSMSVELPGQSSDFSMIEDMLDVSVNAANIDWEMWDNQMTSGQQLQTWPVPPAPSNASEDHIEDYRAGNAILGGSGLVERGGSDAVGNQHSVPQYHRTWVDDFEANTAATAPNVGISQSMLPNRSQQYEVPRVVPRGPSTVAWGPGIWDGDFDTLQGTKGSDDRAVPNMSDVNFDMNDSMSVPLQDVSFDLGVTDYNRNGMYPATKDDWQDFWQRSRTGLTPGT